jgi:hypothetical protein
MKFENWVGMPYNVVRRWLTMTLSIEKSVVADGEAIKINVTNVPKDIWGISATLEKLDTDPSPHEKVLATTFSEGHTYEISTSAIKSGCYRLWVFLNNVECAVDAEMILVGVGDVGNQIETFRWPSVWGGQAAAPFHYATRCNCYTAKLGMKILLIFFHESW